MFVLFVTWTSKKINRDVLDFQANQQLRKYVKIK